MMHHKIRKNVHYVRHRRVGRNNYFNVLNKLVRLIHQLAWGQIMLLDETLLI